MRSKLILIRHGQSQWNLENRFTGWIDIGLTEKGVLEAKLAGEKIKDVPIHAAFTSVLARAIDTLKHVLEGAGQSNVPFTNAQELNERHYGDLQGLNKAETAQKFGEAQVKLWRRSYDVRPPNGESLAMVVERVKPYLESKILPRIFEGKNVVVAAHGNSLRAIVKILENIDNDSIVSLEIPNGEPWIYEFEGKQMKGKTILA